MAITQDQQFTNNATTTVPGSLTNVATSITVSTGTGSLFPTLSGAQFFVATIVNSISSDPGFGQLEIVKVTARSGDVLTVVRGQESTSAKSFPAGCVFELRPTAGGINEVYNKMIAGDALQAPIASPTFTGDPKAPTPALGDNDTSIATTGYVQTAFNTYGDRHVNIIVNPNGLVQQETTTPVTANGAYFADQWLASFNAAGGAFQAGVANPSPAVSNYDFSNLFLKTTTIKASLAAGDFVALLQPVEGYYIRRLQYGTAAAKTSWLRFRASSTQSGTASVSIRNSDNTRTWVQSFSVTTTPTDYSFQIPGDTAGTWVTGNTKGAELFFVHAAGTNAQTSSLGVWAVSTALAANTQSNMMDTVNRQLNITDVQWNDAPILLPFQSIDYQQELVRCQRYWESGRLLTAGYQPDPANPAGWFVPFFYKVTKRIGPTITFSGRTSAGVILGTATGVAFGENGVNSFLANYQTSGAGGLNVTENVFLNARM